MPLSGICILCSTDWVRGPAGAAWTGVAVVTWFVGAFTRGSLMQRGGAIFWGVVTGIGLLYVAALASALTQPLSTLQKIAMLLDPVHATGASGPPLPEKSYGAMCAFSLQNLSGHCDIFILAHVFGWIAKALMFRDALVSVVLSILFELMEYTFEYLQPNFAECWWDHWLLDFLLCNGVGIWVGHVLLRATRSREYNWCGFTVADREKGLFGFSLNSLRRSELARDPRRAAALMGLCAWIMAIDLNAFFLKYMLRVLPSSPLNAIRLLLMALLGAAAMREYYASIVEGGTFGPSGTLALVGTLLETVVVLKFSADVPEWQSARMPTHVAIAWGCVAAAVSGVCIVTYVLPRFNVKSKKN